MATILDKARPEILSLAGKRVAITGGTVGIGRAIAVLLASEGAHVFICGREDRFLTDALADIRSVGAGDGMTIDLADTGAPQRFIESAVATLGGLDVAVINAGISASGLSQMTADEVHYAVSVNYTGYVMTAHAAMTAMQARHDEGDIILIGSMAAHVLGPGSTVYAGTKAGIAGFAEALRRELGHQGIRVSLVEPGKTGSNMQLPDLPVEEQQKRIRQETMLRAEDIAAGVHYVLSQPRRIIVQQLTIVPRAEGGE